MKQIVLCERKSWGGELRFWRFAACLWAGATLSFMAGMSIAGTLFLATSVVMLVRTSFLGLLPFFRSSKYTKSSFFLLLVSFLSFLACFLSPPLGIPPQGKGEIAKFYYFLFPYLLCGVLVASELEGKDLLRLLFRVLDISALASALVGIFQFWSPALLPARWVHGHFFRVVSLSPHCHAQGLMLFHLSYASAMCFPAAYAWARFFWRQEGETERTWWGHGALGLLCSLAVFYSYSRIAWFALLALFLTLGFLRKPRWGIFIILACGLFSAGIWFASSSVRSRMLDNGGGAWERVVVWRASLEMIRDRPWLGVGFGKTGQYSEAYGIKAFGEKQLFASHSHNNLIDAFASTGIFGFLAFLFWWGWLFLSSYRHFRWSSAGQKWLPAACIAAGIAFQVNGLTQVNFYDAKSQHSLFFWAGLILFQEWQRWKAASTT